MASGGTFAGTATLIPEDDGGDEIVVLVELRASTEGTADEPAAGWLGRAWADHPWVLRHIGTWVTVRTAEGQGRALLTSTEGHLAGSGPAPWT